MKHLYSFLLPLLLLLSGCGLLENAPVYESATRAFMESLIDEDYDKCANLLAYDGPQTERPHPDSLRATLKTFREGIVFNFGKDLTYKFVKAERRFGSERQGPPNSTMTYTEMSNGREYGILQVIFDNSSSAIMGIELLPRKMPVPDMGGFWLFGLLALGVVVFNIYVITRVRRSDITRKWLKYLAIIFLNVPTIGYNAASGFFFKLFYFQVLLGAGLSYTGYLERAWSLGIPIGGLVVLWRLRNGLYRTTGDDLPDNLLQDDYPVIPSPKPSPNETTDDPDKLRADNRWRPSGDRPDA